MSWWNTKPFTFNRKPARRRPVRRAPAIAVRQLERRLTPSNVTQFHYDNASDGVNGNETVLTTSNVTSSGFGTLFTTPVDGNVYAQSLYMSGVTITTGAGQGTHNVVFVATENDSLYAIDANNGSVLWKDSFLAGSYLPAGAVVTPIPGQGIAEGSDIAGATIGPNVGITGTPVIDPSTNTLYVVSQDMEVYGGNQHFVDRLHAINIANGAEAMGGPAVIADTTWNGGAFTYNSGPSVAGTGDGGTVDNFNALTELQQSGLTLINGSVYIGFGQDGTATPAHGWVLGYNASSLALNAVFNDTPNGSGGSISQSGDTLAGEVNPSANTDLYVLSGLGTFDTTLNGSGFPSSADFAASFIKLETNSTTSGSPGPNGWGIGVVDYFTPHNESTLQSHFISPGPCGAVLLPASAGTTAHPNILIALNSSGEMYVLDRNNMGKFNSSTDSVIQEEAGPLGAGGTPVFFNNTLYVTANSGGTLFANAQAYSFSSGMLSSSPIATSGGTFGSPVTPVLSANGTSNAIFWAVNPGTNRAIAFNASNLSTLASFPLGTTLGIGTCMEANGELFATGCSTGQPGSDLVGLGLLAAANAAPPAPTLSATYAGPTSATLAWGNSATAPNLPTSFNILESTDGVNFTTVATTDGQTNGYTLQGLLPETSYTFEVSAADGFGTSAVSNKATIVTLPAAGALNFSGPGIVQTTLAAGSTTIASASNGLSLPQATINVASTTGFTSSGTITVVTSLGPKTVTYTGVTATSFTGCTGGAGKMSTGGAVTGNISAKQTTITVASGTGIVNGDVLVIGTEEMQVTAGGGTTTLTVTRGFNGTTAATAGTGAIVTASFVAPAAQTTLNGAITSSQTTITVNSGTGIFNSDVLVIGTEEMQVTGGGGTTSLTVTRGFNKTTAASASSGAIVTAYTNAFAGETALTLNGGNAQITSAGALQLTDSGGGEADSAFTTSAMDITHFVSSWTFSQAMGSNPTADGMSFCIQGSGNTAVGGGGGDLGLYGISNSLAIKFDLYSNNGEGIDSTGLFTSSGSREPFNQGSIDLTPTGINWHSGDVFVVGLSYDGTTLDFTVTDTSTNVSWTQLYPVNIPAIVGGNTAFVGFTAGTGGLTAVQAIQDWSYNPITQPKAPTDLIALVTKPRQVTLTWTDNATNESGFVIERATNSRFTVGLVTFNAPPGATPQDSFVDNTVAKGKTYYYRVEAVNIAGTSTWSDTAGATTPAVTATAKPAAPTNAAASTTATSVTLSWQDNANNECGFEIFRRTGTTGKFVAIATVPADLNPAPSTVTFVDTTVKKSKTYEYHIEAYNLVGFSKFADVIATTPAAPVSGALAPVGGGGGRRLLLSSSLPSDSDGSSSDSAGVGSSGTSSDPQSGKSDSASVGSSGTSSDPHSGNSIPADFGFMMPGGGLGSSPAGDSDLYGRTDQGTASAGRGAASQPMTTGTETGSSASAAELRVGPSMGDGTVAHGGSMEDADSFFAAVDRVFEGLFNR
jgi:hypothetical protein